MPRTDSRGLPDSCGNTVSPYKECIWGRETDSEAGKTV